MELKIEICTLYLKYEADILHNFRAPGWSFNNFFAIIL